MLVDGSFFFKQKHQLPIRDNGSDNDNERNNQLHRTYKTMSKTTINCSSIEKKRCNVPLALRLISPAFPPEPKQQPDEDDNNNQLHG